MSTTDGRGAKDEIPSQRKNSNRLLLPGQAGAALSQCFVSFVSQTPPGILIILIYLSPAYILQAQSSGR